MDTFCVLLAANTGPKFSTRFKLAFRAFASVLQGRTFIYRIQVRGAFEYPLGTTEGATAAYVERLP
jgi:hypothetical protein